MFESQIQNSNLNWLLTAYMFGIVMIQILEIFRFTRLDLCDSLHIVPGFIISSDETLEKWLNPWCTSVPVKALSSRDLNSRGYFGLSSCLGIV